jgi:hypothetical protein
MIDKPLQIPVTELGGESALYMDYVAGKGAPIQEILGGFGAADERWGRLPPAREPGKSWAALVDRLVDYNRALDVAGDVVDKLVRCREGGTVRFVVTGQQPGALGGPLLALYKLATAIELAQALERSDGTPSLPLYWIGADDADFQEVRELFLVDCNLTPLSTSIDQASHAAASPVGDISSEALERVWLSIEPLVARCPRGEYTADLVRRAVAEAADHGEVTARIIAALVEGRAALIDSREPCIRLHARDLFLEYFDRESEIRETIEATGRKLESLGYHAQLSLGPDSGVFLIDGGRRKKITESQRAEARRELSRDVTRFSPGVVLRNLVQDHVLKPAAVVLGPAEIAYRAQLDGVYRMLDVPQPVAFPRMHATYLPPPVPALPGVTEPGRATELLRDPTAFVKAVYASRRSEAVGRSSARFRRVFEAETEAFLDAAREALDERALSKTRNRLSDVARRLAQALDVGENAGKAAAVREWPFLPGLAEFVRRGDKPQDRYVSSLTPFVFAGRDARDRVSASAAAFVQAALDGPPPHVVYSTAE